MLFINQPVISVPESSAPAETIVFNRALLKQWRRAKRQALVLSLCLITANDSALCDEQDIQPLPIPEKTGALSISLRGNRLSIQANQVPWQKMLAQLELITHLSVYAKSSTSTSTVSVAIPFLPVNEALRQLFSRRFDYVFLYSGFDKHQTGIPKAVWLLNDLNENGTHTDLAIHNQAGDTSDASQGHTQNNENTDAAIQDLIEKAEHAESPELRLHALARLTASMQTNKSATKHALETALDDNDARVREYALEALAKGGGQAAIEHLREALEDTAESVRIKAVESIAREGLGVALLEEALSSPDEIVRFLAEEKLKEMAH